jgi:hypothetical protein
LPGHLAEFSLLGSLLLVFPDGALFCFVADVVSAGGYCGLAPGGQVGGPGLTSPVW